MNSHTVYQQNGLKSLINHNDRDDMKMNTKFQNGDVSSGIGLINRHTITKFKGLIKLNDMNRVVKNGDVGGGNCYMNTHTISEAKEQNVIDYTGRID